MPRTTVEVRRAGVEDVDHLLHLAQRARLEEHPPSRPDPAAQRTRATTALGRGDVTVFLALVGQQPVGVVVLRVGELVPLCGADAVHVEQLFVDPEWRRRGVARQLLSQAAATAEQHDASDIVCTLPPGVREAQRFLARLGFAPLVVQRAVPVGTLRRKLAGDAGGSRRKATMELVLARRRAARERRPVEVTAGSAGAPARPSARTAAPRCRRRRRLG
jgi:ribosomal protein S18 acetylase RimI-like enzyme